MRHQLYEGMFLVDNDRVREDWKRAKALVTDVIAKHGGEIESARRWDERRLAYTIEGKTRATFLLTFFRIDTQKVAILRRDLELSEPILRYLIKRVEAVPAAESALAQAELAADFVVPAPPLEDEVVDQEEEVVFEEADDERAAIVEEDIDGEADETPVSAGSRRGGA